MNQRMSASASSTSSSVNGWRARSDGPGYVQVHSWKLKMGIVTQCPPVYEPPPSGLLSGHRQYCLQSMSSQVMRVGSGKGNPTFWQVPL